MSRRFPGPVLAALAAIYFIWGSTFLGIKVVVGSLPPLLMAGTRATIAGSALYVWARARGASPPDGRRWLAGCFAGFLLFGVGHGTLFWVSQRIPSGLASVLESTIPIWVVAIERLGPEGAPIRRHTGAGVFLGFLGVVWLNLPGIGSRTVPAWSLVLLTGAASWACGTVWYRGDRRPPSPRLTAALPLLTGGLLLLAASALAGEPARVSSADLDTTALLALAYLIVFGSLIAFSAYSWLLGRVSPTTVASYAYVNPVVALTLGWLLAGETLQAATVGPIALVLGAVVLIIVGERA